jgi:hypothetical protein
LEHGADLDLVGNISKNGTTLVNYSYLANGVKLSALDGNGEGLMYRGPFVYRKSSDSGVMDEVDAYRAQYSWIGEFNCNFRDPLDENPINQAMSDANMRIKSVTNINEITPNFVNQIYYNKEYIYPPKIINIDYWNSN